VSVPAFLLDHNFPLPIVGAFRPFLKTARLATIGEIDPSLANLDDDVLIRRVGEMGDWDGLITNDKRMLSIPEAIVALCQTRLTLVVASGIGHDPVTASGLVLASIDNIAKRTRRDVAQLWLLNANAKEHTDPWSKLRDVARHLKMTDVELIATYENPAGDE
jgi:hypothetical protein